MGHRTLGAAVPQTLTLIDRQVAAGALANRVVRRALAASHRVHLIGMVSDGGVHSSLSHLEALVDLAASLRVADLVVHCFTDGRDTLPTSAPGFLERLEDRFRSSGLGRVATITGRYFGMDRDRRWERTQAAYDLQQMLQPGAGAGGGPVTTPSCNPVPLIVTASGVALAPRGTLADVAPTILELLAIAAPASMTGESLLRMRPAGARA